MISNNKSELKRLSLRLLAKLNGLQRINEVWEKGFEMRRTLRVSDRLNSIDELNDSVKIKFTECNSEKSACSYKKYIS